EPRGDRYGAQPGFGLGWIETKALRTPRAHDADIRLLDLQIHLPPIERVDLPRARPREAQGAEQTQLKGRCGRENRLQLDFRKDPAIGFALAGHALQLRISLQDVGGDVFRIERVTEDRLRRLDRFIDLRDGIAALSQGVEMRPHITAPDAS